MPLLIAYIQAWLVQLPWRIERVQGYTDIVLLLSVYTQIVTEPVQNQLVQTHSSIAWCDSLLYIRNGTLLAVHSLI